MNGYLVVVQSGSTLITRLTSKKKSRLDQYYFTLVGSTLSYFEDATRGAKVKASGRVVAAEIWEATPFSLTIEMIPVHFSATAVVLRVSADSQSEMMKWYRALCCGISSSVPEKEMIRMDNQSFSIHRTLEPSHTNQDLEEMQCHLRLQRKIEQNQESLGELCRMIKRESSPAPERMNEDDETLADPRRSVAPMIDIGYINCYNNNTRSETTSTPIDLLNNDRSSDTDSAHEFGYSSTDEEDYNSLCDSDDSSEFESDLGSDEEDWI